MRASASSTDQVSEALNCLAHVCTCLPQQSPLSPKSPRPILSSSRKQAIICTTTEIYKYIQMNISQLKHKMRDNEQCIKHSLSKMHSSLNNLCCKSSCCQSSCVQSCCKQQCYVSPPPEQNYNNDEINYKLNRLKLQNKVLRNELNRKQIYSEDHSRKTRRRDRERGSDSQESLEKYTIRSLKTVRKEEQGESSSVPHCALEVQQLRSQAMQLLRVIEQDDQMFSHFRSHFMNITDFMQALNNNHYSSILIQFIQFVQDMLASQVYRRQSPMPQEVNCHYHSQQDYPQMASQQTWSNQNPPHQCTSPTQLIDPCEQQQMYSNYMNKQEHPQEQRSQYSPNSISRIYRQTPPPVYQSLQHPIQRQSSVKTPLNKDMQERSNNNFQEKTNNSNFKERSNNNLKERTLNQMKNTFSESPWLKNASEKKMQLTQQTQCSRTKTSVHKSVCPHLSRSLKKSVPQKKTVRMMPPVKAREPTYWAEDIAPPRKVQAQSDNMNRIIKGMS